MSTVRIEPLQADEQARLRRRASTALPATAFFAVFSTLFVAIPVGIAVLLHPALSAILTVLAVAACVAFACVLVLAVLTWQNRRLLRDLKRNQKIVLDTTAERIDERYFRRVFSYYLTIPDEGPNVPHRRFQIDKDSYSQLRRGEPIRIAFLPGSGELLSIDGASCRY